MQRKSRAPATPIPDNHLRHGRQQGEREAALLPDQRHLLTALFNQPHWLQPAVFFKRQLLPEDPLPSEFGKRVGAQGGIGHDNPPTRPEREAAANRPAQGTAVERASLRQGRGRRHAPDWACAP